MTCAFPGAAQPDSPQIKRSSSGVHRSTRNRLGSAQSISSRSTGVAHGQQQVARWVVPICIKVIGAAAPQAARVVGDQMLGVAREANIPLLALVASPTSP